MKTIHRNMIQCLRCLAVIESRHEHDYVKCPCGKVAVDGGHERLYRTGRESDYMELSVMSEAEVK